LLSYEISLKNKDKKIQKTKVMRPQTYDKKIIHVYEKKM